MFQANQTLREILTKKNIKPYYSRFEILEFLREQDEKGDSRNGI